MERLTGYIASDAIGKKCGFIDAQERSPEERNADAHGGERNLLSQPQGSDRVIRWENSIRACNGAIIPVLTSAQALRDETGAITGLIETLTDLRYRIKVFDIHTPSLMERQEDIPMQATSFIVSNPFEINTISNAAYVTPLTTDSISP